MTTLKNIHPGEVLSGEFLIANNISAYKLSKDIGIPQTRISEIIKGNRRITADTALRFSKYLLFVFSIIDFISCTCNHTRHWSAPSRYQGNVQFKLTFFQSMYP